MILDKDNYYFLAPDNKNGLSVRPPHNLYLAAKFEFKVKFKVDFEKCKGETRGIVMMNGKHLGINIWNDKLNGSIWTEDGIFDSYVEIDDTYLGHIECTFICDNKNKQISLIVGDRKTTTDFTGDLVDDYKHSYIWVGCGNGHKDIDEEFKNQFFGDIYHLEVKRDDKTIFKSNFKKKTEFKVFDESNSGNHLLKYNSEWY